MNTFKLNQRASSLIIFVLVLLLAGCQEAAPTAEIVAEKTSSCEESTYEEGTILVENAGAEYGEVGLGVHNFGRMECDDAYLKGNYTGIAGQTAASASLIFYVEIATDEGGYWRCNGEFNGDYSNYTCHGDLKYSGLEMNFKLSPPPYQAEYTITKATEN